MNREITITIVLYEENYLSVSKCLENLKSFQIIIIDNAGDHELKKKILDKFNIYKYIINKTNEGFSKGANQAIKLCDTEYILNIESDCLINEKDILNLLESLKKYKNCMVVTPTFYNEDSTISYNGGPLPEKELEIRPLLLEGDICVESCSTAAILFRKKDFLELGLFDENLFIYFPDFEIGRRIKELKKSIIQVFKSRSHHVHGELKVKNFLRKIYFRNYYFTLDELIYFYKTNTHQKKFKELEKKIPKYFIQFILNLFILRLNKCTYCLSRILAYYKFKKLKAD